MHPVLLRGFGPFNVYAYGTFLGLGFFVGALLILWYVKKYGVEPRLTDRVRGAANASGGRTAAKNLLDRRIHIERVDALQFVVIVVFSAVIGGRLLYILVNDPLSFLKSPLRIVLLWKGGVVFYGGVMGATVATWVLSRKRNYSFLSVADIFLTAAMLGYMFGRTGCLLAGCCFGKACDLPWAITFTDPQAIAFKVVGSVPVHPTQIYAGLSALLIFFVLLYSQFHKRFVGQTTLLGFTLYPIARFTIECFRGDPHRGTFDLGFATWTTSQLLSAVAFTGAILVWGMVAIRYRRGRRVESRASARAASG